MTIRVFRALGTNTPVLEIGRLRVWIREGVWPRLPYYSHRFGVRAFGMGYVCFNLFDKRSRPEPSPK